MVEYDAKKIEIKWQDKWEKDKIFEVKENPEKLKYYVLEMYPYPSGKLHMGHLRNYTIGDTIARYKRMKGFNVLYPMGYDSFGMPAENAAIDEGANPKIWTDYNIELMKNQQKLIGLSYDWTREVHSHDPNYYKWDQWFFLKMLGKGLAYKEDSYVNWCPKCVTVLANEQAQGGKCWRCNNDVDQKFLSQWFLKIRDYAEELLDGLNLVEWPEKVKLMQRNWIGRSEGSIIKFPIVGENRTIDIYTTRPDTLYGVTFMIFAPEHPWVRDWVKDTEYEDEYERLSIEILKEGKFQRTDIDVEKKGMFIGKNCINPATNEEIPVYIGNFVIYEYGAGAVMAVPAHDQRDFEFAKLYNVPIKIVIQPHEYELGVDKMSRAYEGDGVLINSEEFNGIENRSAVQEITDKLNKLGMGYKTINYKIRDWGISRQRYWGCPIPIIYCDQCGTVPVPYDNLPVLLPKDVIFTGSGNPLVTSESFVNVKCPRCGREGRRETDTMDTFIDSSWYFFAFCDPPSLTTELPYKKDKINYWGNVDQYIGGIEHAVMHLIYARFFTKMARDFGLHKFDEPFQRLLTQGMINKKHPYCSKCDRFAMKAESHDIKCKFCQTPYILKSVKMSKSYGNTVDPGEIMNVYGADAARFFILFGASPSSGLEWSDEGVGFANKFLNKTFHLFTEQIDFSRNVISIRDTLMSYKLNKTIKAVSTALEKIEIRDAVNNIILFTTELVKYKSEGVIEEIYNECLEKLALIMHPIVPHLTEEIWELLGKKNYLSLTSWPIYDEELITAEFDFKWSLMVNIMEDINNIRLVMKKEKLEKIFIFIAAEWKNKFYSQLIDLIKKTRDQGEIIKALMQDHAIRSHGVFINQTVSKLLKNVGKFSKISLPQKEELQFFKEIKQIIEKKFKCSVEIKQEEYSKEIKASQALPGKPAIVII
ncbi:MAG: Leucine--tRNA ligase subunit alpha [Candidatus Lokiarchaeum sp. GC14_75]|nr:MAG: Leucine--tRNA ligase subunit alpha [Candidatus Lokiarchaeum sp. GC14_75]